MRKTLSGVGARQMAIERPPGAIEIMIRIKMQHYDFTPVGTFRVGIEQSQIGDEVFLIVAGQYGTGGRGIGYFWIKRRRCSSRKTSGTPD